MRWDLEYPYPSRSWWMVDAIIWFVFWSLVSFQVGHTLGWLVWCAGGMSPKRFVAPKPASTAHTSAAAQYRLSLQTTGASAQLTDTTVNTGGQ